ncbi:MAG: leucine-rich repeat domain-containing protein [Candidatus Muirbacterium halophilum]|nr:leucine-rich repeat domain-containing protein [Candidatus Muirbacterium halophilum]
MDYRLSEDSRRLIGVKSSLIYAKIPDSVTEINGWAFFGCDIMDTLIMSKNVEYLQGYISCPKLSHLSMPNVSKISKCVLVDCKNLIEIETKLSKQELISAFGSKEIYNKYIQRNRDYKLKKMKDGL